MARKLLAFTLASGGLLAASGPARADGNAWGPVLSVGPTFGPAAHTGMELALDWIRHVEKLNAGVDYGRIRGGLSYTELQVMTGYDERHGYPLATLVAGAGLAWEDGKRGYQVTLSANVAVFPFLYLRARRMPDADLAREIGAMIKIPLPLTPALWEDF